MSFSAAGPGFLPGIRPTVSMNLANSLAKTKRFSHALLYKITMNSTTAGDAIQQATGTKPEDITKYEDGVNSVFNVVVDGETVVAKFGTFDPTSVRVEPYVLRWLEEQGLPTPTVHHIGKYSRTPFFIMEELTGTQYKYPSEISIEKLTSAAQKIGALLAQAHQEEIGIGPLSVADSKLVAEDFEWNSFFTRHMEKFIQQAKHNYPDLGSEGSRLFHWAEIPPADGGYFCPLDMHTRNLFVKDKTVTGVMDFERCYGGHSALGYAVTLYTIRAGRTDDNIDRIEQNFKQGYEQHREAPDIAPVFKLAAVLREMRAAHIWWDNPEDERERLQNTLSKIETQIKHKDP